MVLTICQWRSPCVKRPQRRRSTFEAIYWPKRGNPGRRSHYSARPHGWKRSSVHTGVQGIASISNSAVPDTARIAAHIRDRRIVVGAQQIVARFRALQRSVSPSVPLNQSCCSDSYPGASLFLAMPCSRRRALCQTAAARLGEARWILCRRRHRSSGPP